MDNNQDINTFIEKELHKIIATLSDNTLFERFKTEEQSINKTIESYNKTGELEFKQEQNKILQKFTAKTFQVKSLIENLNNEKNSNLSAEYAEQIENALKELISKIEYEQENEIRLLKERINLKIETLINSYKEKIKDLPQKRVGELNKIIETKSKQLQVLDDFYETASFDAEIWKDIRFTNKYPQIKHLTLGELKKNEICFHEKFNYSIPLPYSFYNRNSLIIKVDTNGKPFIKTAIDQIVLRSLASAEAGNILFYFCDLYDNGSRFLDYLELPKEIYNKKIITSYSEFEKLIFDLQKLENDIIQNTLKTYDLETFNTKFPKTSIPLRIVILDNFPHGITTNLIPQIEKLTRTAIKAGIHFVFITDDEHYAQIETLKPFCKEYIISNKTVLPDDTSVNRIRKQILELTDKQFNTQKSVYFEDYYNSDFQWWTGKSAERISISIGLKGAEEYKLHLGAQVTENCALITGVPGSGKSFLLHNIITSACLAYSPNELRLFLTDLKSGVEFQRYAANKLPHAEFIALNSSPEYGVHILKVLVDRMNKRGEYFTEKGANTLPDFRKMYPDEIMPRYLIVIDEYHEMFSNSSTKRFAEDYLSSLVRKGRSFGYNLLLASQDIDLSEDIANKIAIKGVLRAGWAIARRALGGSFNDIVEEAPKLKVGQLIINDGNDVSKIQSFYLDKDVNNKIIEQICEKWKKQTNSVSTHRLVVFNREANAYLKDNQTILDFIPQENETTLVFSPGEKTMVDGTDFISDIYREVANNILVTGGKSEISVKAFYSTFFSILPSLNIPDAEIHLFNFANKKDFYYSQIKETCVLLNTLKNFKNYESDVDINVFLDGIVDILIKRQSNTDDDDTTYPPIFVAINNIENYGDFLKSTIESEYTVSKPIQRESDITHTLKKILKNGSEVGVHFLIHSSSPETFESIFDIDDLDLFAHRVLLQMSDEQSVAYLAKGRYQKDAANLFDAKAGKSGHNRAIYYESYSKTIEVIKPYEFPTTEEIELLIKTK